MKSQSYKDLILWQKAIELATWIYGLTAQFPKEEIYGLVSQMRRAAVSVPSNIAEGQSRQHKTEFRQFLYIAKGSLSELETQLTIASNLGYVNEKDFQEGATKIDETENGKQKTENCFEAVSLESSQGKRAIFSSAGSFFLSPPGYFLICGNTFWYQ